MAILLVLRCNHSWCEHPFKLIKHVIYIEDLMVFFRLALILQHWLLNAYVPI